MQASAVSFVQPIAGMQRDPSGRPRTHEHEGPPAPTTPRAVEVERAPAVDEGMDGRLELRRAAEDLQATRVRIERDAQRAEMATRARLVGELLPVLDNLDRTIEAGSVDATMLQGVKLVRAQLERVLGNYGLERIAAVGAGFDPRHHDAVAVAQVHDPSADGVVIEELSRGYRMAGLVLVPARVRVGKLAEQPESRSERRA